MRYVAAYLLAELGGKANPAASDLEKILSSVGIEADAEKLKKVIAELAGKSIEELIAAVLSGVPPPPLLVPTNAPRAQAARSCRRCRRAPPRRPPPPPRPLPPPQQRRRKRRRPRRRSPNQKMRIWASVSLTKCILQMRHAQSLFQVWCKRNLTASMFL
ncbi:uncharacterized protein LOC133528828 isoform X1 [Cydia pomonella]|uniref:uncharacterized protein LOC133528828 isoform X1 n=1 Tax=Cydia pomonella TaxID=82600 RepID=UPI002ADDCA14|nr:uncharacterized protein LOC133528828 isoform X1 [Cydia pomonella]